MTCNQLISQLEQYPAIDVGVLKSVRRGRGGAANSPQFGARSLVCSDGDGNEVVQVRVYREGLGMTPHHAAISVNGKSTAVGIAFTQLTWGLRAWWVCPSCFRRTKKLYVAGSRSEISCRLCHGLRFRSQQSWHFRKVLGRELGIHPRNLGGLFRAAWAGVEQNVSRDGFGGEETNA